MSVRGVLRALERSPAALLRSRQDQPRGTPLAHVACAACGTRAATVERAARGALRVRTGRRDRSPLLVAPGVACPAHGPLRVTWEALEPYLARTRPGTYRATPQSMP